MPMVELKKVMRLRLH